MNIFFAVGGGDIGDGGGSDSVGSDVMVVLVVTVWW